MDPSAQLPAPLHFCKNCDSELIGEYCHQCGQQDKQYVRSMFAAVGDLFGEIGHWDSRFYRTLVGLMARPGFLSLEFVRGRHASYVPPLRLYFFISLISFLILTSFIDFDTIDSSAFTGPEPVAVEGEPEKKLSPKIEIGWLSDAEEAEINTKLQYLADNPKILVQRLVSLAPQMMLLMLPFWALFLKLIYIFNRHYYLEHLAVALHTHAFLLMSITGLTILSVSMSSLTTLTGNPQFVEIADWLETSILVWMATYMLITQKLFYQQGWWKTLFKFMVCSLAYIVLLSGAFIVLIIYGILTA